MEAFDSAEPTATEPQYRPPVKVMPDIAHFAGSTGPSSVFVGTGSSKRSTYRSGLGIPASLKRTGMKAGGFAARKGTPAR